MCIRDRSTAVGAGRRCTPKLSGIRAEINPETRTAPPERCCRCWSTLHAGTERNTGRNQPRNTNHATRVLLSMLVDVTRRSRAEYGRKSTQKREPHRQSAAVDAGRCCTPERSGIRAEIDPETRSAREGGSWLGHGCARFSRGEARAWEPAVRAIVLGNRG